jgi:hypothetical protein
MRNFSSKEIGQFLWKFLLTFFLYLSYFTEGRSYVVNNLGQYATGFMDGAVVSISCLVLILYLTDEKKEGVSEIDYIEGISAYLFFPPGIPREQQTFDYHRKHLRHRLIVNHNTKPPKAYYLTSSSYGWKFVEKHPDIWVSEVVDSTGYSIDDSHFTEEWCNEKEYELNRRPANKKDLLESG